MDRLDLKDPLVRKVLVVILALKDHRVSLEHKEQEAQLDHRVNVEMQAQMADKESVVRLVKLAQRVHQDLMVTVGHLDHKDPEGTRAIQERLDLMDLKDLQEQEGQTGLLVLLERKDYPVLRVKEENKVQQEKLAKQVNLEKLDPRDHVVNKDLVVRQADPEIQALLVSLDSQAIQDQMVAGVIQERVARLGPLVM